MICACTGNEKRSTLVVGPTVEGDFATACVRGGSHLDNVDIHTAVAYV